MNKEFSIDQINAFIGEIADVKPSTIPGDEDAMCYYSKVDGAYLTRVGMEDSLLFLLRNGITEQIQSINGGKVACLGFNPEEQKWYGWSHRALYGFGIGSDCKKGHVHYQPANKEDFMEDCLRFWADENKLDMAAIEASDEKGRPGVQVSWVYSQKVPNERIRGTVGDTFSPYPEQWGRGEWTATTMEEAREMAETFAEEIG